MGRPVKTIYTVAELEDYVGTALDGFVAVTFLNFPVKHDNLLKPFCDLGEVTTPLELYEAAWEKREAKTLLLRNGDSVCQGLHWRGVLKPMMEIEYLKTLKWETLMHDIMQKPRDPNIPQSYNLLSNLVILANNPGVQALALLTEMGFVIDCSGLDGQGLLV